MISVQMPENFFENVMMLNDTYYDDDADQNIIMEMNEPATGWATVNDDWEIVYKIGDPDYSVIYFVLASLVLVFFLICLAIWCEKRKRARPTIRGKLPSHVYVCTNE